VWVWSGSYLTAPAPSLFGKDSGKLFLARFGGQGRDVSLDVSASQNRIAADDRGVSARAGWPRWRERICVCFLGGLFAFVVILLGNADAYAHTHARPRHKHAALQHRAGKLEHAKHHSAEAAKRSPVGVPLPIRRPALADLPPELASVKQALDLVGLDSLVDATALEDSISDPAAKTLIEWAILRRADNEVGFHRYDAFIKAHPDWPGIQLLRRHAEAILWRERPDPATVRRFLNGKPTSPIGRLVLARLLMGQGDRAEADREVRLVWRSAPLSNEVETEVLSEFPGLLSRGDQLARMDRLIGAKDFGGAMRAAKRVDDDQVAVDKACAAAEAKSSNAGKLLHAVPVGVRGDLGYALCRIHWLLRNDSPGSNIRGRIVTPKEDIAAAVKLALGASKEDLLQQDTDEWWRERRALARKLLDVGEAATAYQVVIGSAPPANPYYRAEFHFMAGWIALRFLNDPATASKHFALIDKGETDPRVLARAAYWRGRAAEAAGNATEMRAQYEAAGRYPTAYYGQLARLRLGLSSVALLPPPQSADTTNSGILRATDILYKLDEHGLAMNFVSDIAKESNDVATIASLAKISERYHDAQAMLLVGKTALARGMPMDQYAFPDFGVPSYSAVGPALDRCIVYSVVRTESAFDQRDRSAAKAVGLMQVTPEAGRDTAKRIGISYDWDRLVSDPAYNTEMGAAEIAALLKEYRGSYILTFAAYNAGRGRVQQWIALHGDPRDPKVDPVDWVERIPFAETRNYVQRVMENLQVYRARFDSTVATADPSLH
jgi:soluble lytic murein transglycosylase